MQIDATQKSKLEMKPHLVSKNWQLKGNLKRIKAEALISFKIEA
ncbi:hypothetical protein [Abditibacterium utsteinense]|nr:hypothetical protein [Abditibacterium utsteinense]